MAKSKEQKQKYTVELDEDDMAAMLELLSFHVRSNRFNKRLNILQRKLYEAIGL